MPLNSPVHTIRFVRRQGRIVSLTCTRSITHRYQLPTAGLAVMFAECARLASRP